MDRHRARTPEPYTLADVLKDMPPTGIVGAIQEPKLGPVERRTEPRLRKVLKGGEIVFPADTSVQCVIRNLSEHGAHLEVSELVPLTFDLVIVSDMSRHPCRVVWRQGNKVGVVFE